MRTNLPVTQREYAFPEGQTLVSVTDLKGRITYCNASFIAVSGFTKPELLGQPHNLVRHPDMPEEAFRDMWETIQSGLPWCGLVKNRRKNGDHYWVQANATPMMDGTRITGFLSVRTHPSREAVEAADRLYATMREEAQAGRKVHVLSRGKVLENSLMGKAKRLLSPGTTAKVVMVQTAVLGGMAAVATFGSSLSPLWPVLAAVGLTALSSRLVWGLTVQPLHDVVDDANRMASGDLASVVRVDGSGVVGELQQALMQMSVNLRTVVHDTRTELENVRCGANEIASGNQDLSSRTEAQASSLEETAASMEEINSTVKQSADSAKRGANLAQETARVAQRSHEAVQAVSETMDGITESSNRIGEIIHVIEGVAFQTNILALNAAVEAARAGDVGRGFAVVASEVRALAQRTSSAASEIRQLIGESTERVAMGSTRVNEARSRMDEALESVGSVNTVLDQISTASVEQQSGISQINEAVTHMDSITQQNAAMVEELAAAAQSLLGQVDEVNQSMRLFRLKSGEQSVSEVDAVSLRTAAKSAAESPAKPAAYKPVAAAPKTASKPAAYKPAAPAANPTPPKAAKAPASKSVEPSFERAVATTADSDDWETF